MLAADAEGDVGVGLLAFVAAHLHELANAVLVFWCPRECDSRRGRRCSLRVAPLRAAGDPKSVLASSTVTPETVRYLRFASLNIGLPVLLDCARMGYPVSHCFECRCCVNAGFSIISLPLPPIATAATMCASRKRR